METSINLMIDLKNKRITFELNCSSHHAKDQPNKNKHVQRQIAFDKKKKKKRNPAITNYSSWTVN